MARGERADEEQEEGFGGEAFGGKPDEAGEVGWFAARKRAALGRGGRHGADGRKK